MLNANRFWKGVVIPNTYDDVVSLASFQLWLMVNPTNPINPNPNMASNEALTCFCFGELW